MICDNNNNYNTFSFVMKSAGQIMNDKFKLSSQTDAKYTDAKYTFIYEISCSFYKFCVLEG